MRFENRRGSHSGFQLGAGTCQAFQSLGPIMLEIGNAIKLSVLSTSAVRYTRLELLAESAAFMPVA